MSQSIPQTHVCRKCGQAKPFSEFPVARGRISSPCRQCRCDARRRFSKAPFDLPGEEWRKIPGVKADFEVSSLGRFRSVTSHSGNPILYLYSLSLNQGGYQFVSFRRDGARRTAHGARRTAQVHRLVALAFLGSAPDSQPEVNHKNGIKTDNRPGNLEWCSRLENIRHAWDLGLARPQEEAPRGQAHWRSTLTEDEVRQIRSLKGSMHPCEIAERFGTSEGTVRNIFAGRTWRHLEEE